MSEEHPKDHEKKTEDVDKETPVDPKTTMLPNYEEVTRQAAEEVLEGEKENRESTMIPTFDMLAEITRKQVMHDAMREWVKEQEREQAEDEAGEDEEEPKTRKHIIPLKDLKKLKED